MKSISKTSGLKIFNKYYFAILLGTSLALNCYQLYTSQQQQETIRKTTDLFNKSQALFKQKTIEHQNIANGLAELNATIKLCKDYGFEPDEDFYLKEMTGKNIGKPTCSDFLENTKKVYFKKQG